MLATAVRGEGVAAPLLAHGWPRPPARSLHDGATVPLPVIAKQSSLSAGGEAAEAIAPIVQRRDHAAPLDCLVVLAMTQEGETASGGMPAFGGLGHRRGLHAGAGIPNPRVGDAEAPAASPYVQVPGW